MELTVRWSTGTLIVAVTTAVLAAGLGTPETPTAPSARDTTATPPGGEPDPALAASALRGLEVHARVTSGRRYARDRFGAVGYDADGNGCDTRDDALRRDLSGAVPVGDGCGVVGGTLIDPWTGARMRRTSGATLRVDHVVALADAWTTGAQDLSATQRLRLANDPLNLVTTTAAAAAAKDRGDPATWLPPRRASRCPYVARRIAVQQAYHLWVTPTEDATMARVLATCPDEPLPDRQPWPARTPDGSDGDGPSSGTDPAPTAVAPSTGGAGDGPVTNPDRPVHPTLVSPTAAVPAPVAVEPTARTRTIPRRQLPTTPTVADPLPTAVAPSPRHT